MEAANPCYSPLFPLGPTHHYSAQLSAVPEIFPWFQRGTSTVATSAGALAGEALSPGGGQIPGTSPSPGHWSCGNRQKQAQKFVQELSEKAATGIASLTGILDDNYGLGLDDWFLVISSGLAGSIFDGHLQPGAL